MLCLRETKYHHALWWLIYLLGLVKNVIPTGISPLPSTYCLGPRLALVIIRFPTGVEVLSFTCVELYCTCYNPQGVTWLACDK
jgi:hypothetical protein